jgi:hypothetical protein
MAKKQTLKRNYTFSDAKLCTVARQVAHSVEDNLAEFASYGVQDTDVENLRQQEDDFMNLPADIESMGAVVIATENKDALAEKVRMGIRTVRTIAGNKWGTKDARYRSYAFDGMSGLPDEKLHRLGKRVIKLATQQLPDLISEGLTAAFLTNLQNLNNDFDNAIDLQTEAIIERDILTQQRIEDGNRLFKEMMSLCKIGQDIFASTNFAKFKAFTIYHKSKGKPGRKKKEKVPTPPSA